MEIREQAKRDYDSGMSPSEIASKYDLSINTVKSWAKRHWKNAKVQTAPKVQKKGAKRNAPAPPKATTTDVDKLLADAVEENTELTAKQKDFCRFFAKNKNATQAYLKAYGGTYATAQVDGYENLTKPNIKAELRRLREIRDAALDISGNDVIEMHMRIAFADITDFVDFENKSVPVLKNNEPVFSFDDDGEARELTRNVNEVRLKPSAMIDCMIVTVSELANYPNLPTAILSIVQKWKSSAEYSEMITNREYFLRQNPALKKRWDSIMLDTGGALHMKPKQKIIGDTFKMIVKKVENRLFYYPIAFDDEGKTKQMGANFHNVTADVFNDTAISSVGWGMWAFDNKAQAAGAMQIPAAEYIQILDDDNVEMVKGIRFSQLEPGRPIVYEFFEVDGKITFRQPAKGGKLEVVQEKTPYRYSERRWNNGQREVTNAVNYDTLPIIPMYTNRERRSLLTPAIKTKFNARDFLNTIYVSEALQTKFIYWLISGYGGNAEELLKIKDTVLKMGILNPVDENTNIDAKTIEPPFNAHKFIVDALEDEICQDAGIFNPAKVAGSAHIATAIEAGQRPEDMNINGIQREVVEYIRGHMRLAGVESKITFKPYRMVNEAEISTRAQGWVDRGVPLAIAARKDPMFDDADITEIKSLNLAWTIKPSRNTSELWQRGAVKMQKLTIEHLKEINTKPLQHWVWIERLNLEQCADDAFSGYYRTSFDYTKGRAFCCGYPGVGYHFEYADLWR